MQRDISNFRKSYSKNIINEDSVPESPVNLFDNWFNDAISIKGDFEPNAMTLSTIDNKGFPKGRVVLLKFYSDEGFIFFTNYNSEKSVSISDNNKVSISFFWEQLERQVIIKGYADKTSNKISDEYFNSRPKGSKIGALVSSNQSSVIDSRVILEQRFKKLTKEFSNKEIKRPVNWGGFLVKPIEYEFWQGGDNRLHDRIRYSLIDEKWKIDRLSP